MGVDTEMSIGASWSGKSTKTCDLLTVKMQADRDIDITLLPTQMMVVLHNDNILAISDSGTAVIY